MTRIWWRILPQTQHSYDQKQQSKAEIIHEKVLLSLSVSRVHSCRARSRVHLNFLSTIFSLFSLSLDVFSQINSAHSRRRQSIGVPFQFTHGTADATLSRHDGWIDSRMLDALAQLPLQQWEADENHNKSETQMRYMEDVRLPPHFKLWNILIDF